ncbi:hypothetical protein UMZ34_22225 [Halopseudomonas pachastrellae]|nr:hypothetical protein UMZ34_22225 [Halopseudomonas pachastrellae]
MKDKAIQRPAAEDRFHEQLVKLQQWDEGPVPPVGCCHPRPSSTLCWVTRRSVSNASLSRRVSWSAGHRFIGDQPWCHAHRRARTAKSWLSELIACGVSGQSRLTIQGGTISHYAN